MGCGGGFLPHSGDHDCPVGSGPRTDSAEVNACTGGNRIYTSGDKPPPPPEGARASNASRDAGRGTLGLTALVSIGRDGAEAARAALGRCLGGGGVAVFPSDGLYGLACDPLDAVAVERVQRLKGRDDGKSAAVMFLSPLAMRELVAEFGPRTREAVGALLPGPVTLVVANPERRYPLACREDLERLGVRLIGGPLAGVMRPLFQTSANRSGEPPPTRFEDVPPEVVAGADLAIDGGPLGGLPSTVVDISRLDTTGEWTVLRDGALPVEELAAALQKTSRGDAEN
jgi:L-threonylcarbamoyladenylate synthase